MSSALALSLPVGAASGPTDSPKTRRRDTVENLTLLYIFLTPFQFLIFGPSLLPKHESGFGLRMSLADLVFPLLLLAFLLSRRAGDATHRSHTGLLFFALFAAVTLSWFQSIAYWGSLNAFGTGKFVGLIYVIVLAAVLIEVLRDAYIWHQAIDALALSGVVAGAIGLVAWTAWSFGTESYLVEHDRLTSTMFGDPNIFGSFMAVTLTLTIASACWGVPRRRWLWAAGAAVVLVALLLTQSRSGYMGAVVGLVVLAVWLKPSTGFLAVGSSLILIATIGWAGYTWADSPAGLSIPSHSRFSTETLDSRVGFWRKGVELLRTDAIPGIGVGTFQQINVHEEGFARTHNTYLSTLLELGLPGALAVVLLGAGVVRVVRGTHGQLRKAEHLRLAATVSGLLGMLVFAFWVDALYQRHLWILIAIALASANVALSTLREEQSGTIEPQLLMSERVR